MVVCMVEGECFDSCAWMGVVYSFFSGFGETGCGQITEAAFAIVSQTFWDVELNAIAIYSS